MALALSAILGKQASDVQPPVPLPNGLYVVQVTDYEYKAELGQNKNPALDFSFKVTTPVDVDPSECELPKTMRNTFWLTEQSLYRLKDFLAETLKIESEGRTLEDMLPEAKNRMCQAEIVQAAYTPQGSDKPIQVNNFKRFFPLD